MIRCENAFTLRGIMLVLLPPARRVIGGVLFLMATFSFAANATDVRVVRDVPFLAPNRAEKLDVFYPVNAAPGARVPAVVWVHGGGWTGGTKTEARAQEVCTTFARAGYLAINIDYRLGDGAWPTNLFDCKNAVRFLRAHAAEYRVEPERIAIAGGSAGGHLALMVGLTAGRAELEPAGEATPYPGVSSAVRCVIDLYGITDLVTHGQTDEKGEPTATRVLMTKSFKAFGAASAEDPVLRAASPINYVTKMSPPVLLAHGDADKTVDHAQSEKLAQVLAEHGVPHEFILLPGVGHTFDFERVGGKPLPRDLRPTVLAFLAQHVGRR